MAIPASTRVVMLVVHVTDVRYRGENNGAVWLPTLFAASGTDTRAVTVGIGSFEDTKVKLNKKYILRI